MKPIITIAAILSLYLVPVASAESKYPNLSGYICVDPKGIHHIAQDAFNGVFCKLVKNPHKVAPND